MTDPTRYRFLGSLWRTWVIPVVFAILGATGLASPPSEAVVRGFALPLQDFVRGELLLAELNCIGCHEASSATEARLDSKPGPRLDNVGGRLNTGYPKSFLEDPWGTKPGTTMPDVLNGLPVPERKEMIDALTHYLASLGGPPPRAAEKVNRLAQMQGRVLYHRVGCVACHAPSQTAPALFPETHGLRGEETSAQVMQVLEETSVPLGDLRSKYGVAALADFLDDPLRVRPSGRMPSMNLTRGETRAIATYLITRSPKADALAVVSRSGPEPSDVSQSSDGSFVPNPSKAGVGEGLFLSLACAACHELFVAGERARSTLSAPALRDLNPEAERGCLSESPAAGRPRYGLSVEQRESLCGALARRRQLNEPVDPGAVVTGMMARLNCCACHSRDGVGGPSPSRLDYFTSLTEADLGDEGRIPPHLSGVGAKLRADWLEQVLTNRAAVRPYMATRMPQYGAENLANLVSRLGTVDQPFPGALAELASEDPDAGRVLVGANAYSCVTCHRFGDLASLTISVMDLARMAERLKPGWFRVYMFNPVALRPGTRMPAFWEEGEPAPITEILGGDTERQIAAIWSYLKLGPAAKPPPGLVLP